MFGIHMNYIYLLKVHILSLQILMMPKYTSQVVCRFLKPLSVPYHDLANSQHAAVKHRETFLRDKNMGLVNQVNDLYVFHHFE